MPELDGMEAMPRIGAEATDVKFIVPTTSDTDEYICDAIEAEAKGYPLKDASRDDLFHMVRAVHWGKSLIQPAVALASMSALIRLAAVAK